jgi:hypothetical protein
MNESDKNPSTLKPIDYPLNEAAHQWLMPLLHTCYIADKGILEGLSLRQSAG